MDTLYQPMTQQNPFFYQNNNVPNPSNVNQQFNGFGNFKTSFDPLPIIPFNGHDPKGMFNHFDFVNRNDLLHNNLYNILLNEEIKEYSIMIDSKDRNYQVFPNPFCYDVTFNPLPTKKEKIGGKTMVYEQPNPVINENFANVRYIILEDIILPFFTKIKPVKQKCTKNDEIIETWNINTSKKLTENLYVVLSIGEYINLNYHSTNDVLDDSFATIYFKDKINDTHYRGFSHNGIKIFRQDQLGKIDKLKISFMDPYGIPLSVDHVNKKILSNLECTCENENGDIDTNCFRHNIFHPLNPIFQHHLHFRVGVVEPRLSKMTFN